MAGKRERQRGRSGYTDGAAGDVDSVRDGKYGHVVTLLGHELEYEVTTVETSNGPEVTHLWIKGTGQPITADDLRRIPLRRLAFAAARWSDNAAGTDSEWSTPERAQQRPRQYDDKHYQTIADEARSAFTKGTKVRDSIAKRHHVSPYTVDKWLAECRKRGQLQRGELQRTKNPTAKKDGTNA